MHESHLSCHNNTPKGTKWGHFTCLEVCCYGIDLGASIIRKGSTNQSTVSGGIWTNESAPFCHCVISPRSACWSSLTRSEPPAQCNALIYNSEAPLAIQHIQELAQVSINISSPTYYYYLSQLTALDNWHRQYWKGPKPSRDKQQRHKI